MFLQDMNVVMNTIKIYQDDLNLFEQHERTRQFIHSIVPALIAFLGNSLPSMKVDLNHEVRSLALQLLSRIPMVDELKNCVKSLADVLVVIIQTDNELNASSALQLLLILAKSFFSDIQTNIGPFLQLVVDFYTNLKVRAGDIMTSKPNRNLLFKGNESLKFLAECSYFVSFIFNSKPEHLMNLVLSLLHVMVLSLKINVNYNELIKTHKPFVLALLNLHIRTLDCLHSVNSGDVLELIKIQGQDISGSCINLLLECPNEAVHQRRNILSTIRQAFKTEIRNSYFKHIDFLISEKDLIGKDCTNSELYTSQVNFLIGDIVKSMKGEFQSPQLIELVHFFVRNIHDISFPVSLQLLSVKRLIDLVDNIYQKTDIMVSRLLLSRILNCLVDKCESLSVSIGTITEKVEILQKSSADNSLINDELSLSEVFQIIHMIVQGLKPTVWCITQSEIRPGVRIYGLQPEESEVLARFFEYSMECFRLHQFVEGNNVNVLSKSGVMPKELLESFADVFSVLDTASFRRIFGQRLPLLFSTVRYQFL